MVRQYQRYRFRFGEFELRDAPLVLKRSGQRVRLRPQCLELLKLFVEAAGEPVTRQQIRRHLWNGRNHIDHETSINTTISTLRQALGDDLQRPRFIETLPRTGYRFVAEVSIEPIRRSWRERLRELLDLWR